MARVKRREIENGGPSGPLRRRVARLFAWAAVPVVVLGVAGVDAARADDPTTGPAPAASESTLCAPGVGAARARAVQARYDGIRDLSARFEQRSESATFAGTALMDDGAKRGEVVFAKPGRMRWTYRTPEESLVVSDGNVLWLHDVSGGTATRLEVTAGYLTGAALEFLLGDGRILESFDVLATACEGDLVHLDLTPREEASYERLGLVATPTGDITETSVTDLFGNRTTIRFEDVEVNQAPPAKRFEFTPPEGVEVIDYAGTPGGG